MYCRSQCTSVLTTDNEEHIVTIRGSHNHPTPDITTTSDGVLYTNNNKRGRKKKGIVPCKVNLIKSEYENDVEILP